MMGHLPRRSLRSASTVAGAWVIALGLALFVAGCGDDETTPQFPSVPMLPDRPWFFDIWGSGPNDITIVGRPGLIVHYDGNAWAALPSPTTVPLTGIWGDANGVYACGHQGVILRNTGSGWSAMNSGTTRHLYDIGAGPQNLVYVCGERGELLRLADDRQSWVNTSDSVVHRDDAYAVDDTLHRSEGEFVAFTTISPQAISGAPTVTRLGTRLMTSLIPDPDFGWQMIPVEGKIGYLNAGVGDPNEVTRNWLTSELGRLYRLQLLAGRLSWKERASPSLGDAITAMWGAPGGQTYYFTTRSGKIVRGTVVGNNDNMTHEVVHPGGIWLSGIWGSSTTDIYAVGYDATLLHYDGVAWTPIQVSLPSGKSATAGEPATDKYGQPIW